MESSNTQETQPTPVEPQDTNLASEAAPQEAPDTPPADQPEPVADPDQTVRVPIQLTEDEQADIEATASPSSLDDLPPPPVISSPAPASSGGKPLSWQALTLIGLFGLLLVAALSAFGGYASGIRQRQAAESAQLSVWMDEQFNLAQQDIDARRYDVARQRLERVIEVNPSYPGITDRLAEVLLLLNTRATPTPQPTPTVSPTPDLRGVQELFSQAQQDLSNYEWSKAIETLLSLRKADPAYQAVWVDDMLYISFRNRGADKILKDGDLEGGIYDLTLAEQFGLLDADAKGYLEWARLYITGASFWEINWAQAVYFFGQVAPALPNLRDGSNWTAAERYRLALMGYAGQLANSGDCSGALEQVAVLESMGVDISADEELSRLIENCGDEGDDGDRRNREDGEQAPVETEAPPEPTLEATEEPAPTPYP